MQNEGKEVRAPSEALSASTPVLSEQPPRKKKPKKRNKDPKAGEDGAIRKKPRKNKPPKEADVSAPGLTAAQKAVNEQMRRALEEDQYSAYGSIVDTDSDGEDEYTYRGQSVRLDRSSIQQAMKKGTLFDPARGTAVYEEEDPVDEENTEKQESVRTRRSKAKKKKRRKEAAVVAATEVGVSKDVAADLLGLDGADEDMDRDGGSIFGQTTGSSNSTWVECDKCKKWRRLRGVVDEKKLPSKWFCSMNKNDPERSRCSAPEEEYEAPHTPESAADARTRKHLRVWVRRLQSNEAYEARQPTLTRGKKRAVASSSKDPYEWVRCCNPSCGKWRAVLRIMDAKTNVIDRTTDGEWYCVMNMWDEKTASCAAPQENLPSVGCPPWVMQDEN
ncbi:predicted protein [Phaeodactylum tricornutum CCAP 1055/1]|jgi:hypothetical protein|uniref:CW-type domain-containing protein n=2 Tax=Phaeodactylum tricornutum TaxID=2850 RepID=B7FQW9_PHATC|nr:predicted protein [Phaeodactylum tricornutum CCAP 1055/1]EEC51405.1 predicted protein [Phaeodactylum tricornutum CCAP 1055/1]|eukprot:XP_002176942.1 predicted protein [Phaeodactylum tricornutum CCAP 1055/1]